MITAKIFDIQRFSVDDGPGIRTVLFFQGCPLSCPWCHNPEGMSERHTILYQEDRCVGCGRCVAACDRQSHHMENGKHVFHREDCVGCGKCADVCAEDALRTVSTRITIQQALEELTADLPFYRTSNGGVTLSGGEPLIHEAFLRELLPKLHELEISVCAETSGYVEGNRFRRLAEQIDLFLFDIKETDPLRHRTLTGVDSHLILSNLQTLSALNKPVILRCPLIPSINDRTDHAHKIAELANYYNNVQRVEILPYHSLGLSKYQQLGILPPFSRKEDLSRSTAESFCEQIRKKTSKEVYIN